MIGISRSISAPNLSVRTPPHPSFGSPPHPSFGSLTEGHEEEARYTFSHISQDSVTFPVNADQATSYTRPIFFRHRSAFQFRCIVFALVGIQMFLGSLQWLVGMYRWRPHLTEPERSMSVILLLLSWINLVLAFIGFRRLQFTFPLNWIVFASAFESLTMLVLCLRLIELDLTWPFILFGIGILAAYTALGIWVPSFMTANLWILIVASIVVVVTSTVALLIRLKMRYYVPLSFCLVVFGPWAMFNSQKLFVVHMREGYMNHQYMEAATKMYTNYAITVGSLVYLYNLSKDILESP
ncbi:uncharacterized protein Dana_GF23113 [Drosophila ananassae]|uniref:Uncharacterized protein n=1 Tax=Drosophila ananassae TaxID=7217 RepID=B3MV79_DROAN|nr:uncharacterized protein LOC6505759 [Drosophila ananassae]EDV33144.1 uncharacterized protein Dana_GF23113 [Drosophila ananassae]